MAMLDLDEAEACFDRSVVHARQTSDRWAQAWGLVRLPLIQWARGNLDRATRDGEAACALVNENQDYAEHSLASASLAGVAASRGRFDLTEEHADQAHLMFLRSDYSFSPMIYCLALAYARSIGGDLEGARGALEQWRAAGGRGTGRWFIAVDAVAGNATSVKRQLAARPWARSDVDAPNLFTLGLTGAAVEIGDAIGDRGLVESGANALDEAERRGIRFVLGWPHFVPRLRGVIAYWRRDLDESARRFEEAAAIALAVGSPPERARSELDLARSLAARGRGDDRFRANRLATTARTTFAALEMAPLLARAQAIVSP
jgi:hypothetical protein